MTRISRIQTNGRLDYPVTVRTCHHDEVVGGYREDGSPIRKIRVIRGLDAIPTSVSIEGVPASAWPGGCETRGPKPKKPVESSHRLSFASMPGEDRESQQAQLALSPKSGPRPVLRPPGFALPGPLRRPADPNSPGRIANPSYNRSVMGNFPSAGRLTRSTLVGLTGSWKALFHVQQDHRAERDAFGSHGRRIRRWTGIALPAGHDAQARKSDSSLTWQSASGSRFLLPQCAEGLQWASAASAATGADWTVSILRTASA